MKKNPPPTHSLAHKLLRGTLAVAQVFATLSATIVGIAQPTLPEAIASLQPLIGLPTQALANYGTGAGASLIKGTVYQDYNSNGIQNTTGISPNLSIDWGVGNVTVSGACVTNRGADSVLGTADDVLTTIASTLTTASSYVTTSVATIGGLYTLTVPAGTIIPSGPETTAGQTACRVSFSGFPSGYYPAPVGASGSTTIADSRSDVQFVNADTANVSFGLSYPGDYVQNNPRMVTSMYVNGNPLGGGDAGTVPGIIAFPYSNSGKSPAPTTISNTSSAGSTYGVGWQKTTRTVFNSTVLKRNIGLGPLGLGGVYVNQLNAAGAPIARSGFNLAAAPYNINLGTVGTNAARALPADSGTPNNDPTTFGLVGKTGMGDIDVTEDDKSLFVVNTFSRTLIKLNVNGVAAPTLVGEYPLSSATGVPSCTNGTLRPWALGFHRGMGYLGAICDGASGTDANLAAYVLPFDPATPNAFSTPITVSLSYTRGVNNRGNWVTEYINFQQRWHYWVDTYTADATLPYAANAFAVNLTSGGASSNQRQRPQPILSDIEFDASGALIVGFIDRAGYQLSDENYEPTGSTIVRPFGVGDIIRLCPNGSGGYTQESNGSCGGVTATNPGFENANFAADNVAGVSEFYWGDSFSSDGITPNHGETANGGLAYLPGAPDVAMTAMDPVDFTSGGVTWLSNATGARLRGYQTYTGTISTSPAQGYGGKGTGMGDIEILVDLPPIEIGNRVWWDPDLDGAQDPGERGISNVTMTLWLVHDGTAFADGQALPAGATLVATTTTNSTGNYYFSFEGDATKDNVNGYSNQTWANIGTNFVITGYDTVVQGTPIATSGVVTSSGLITHNKVLPNVVYQVRIAGATTGGSANYTAIDAVDTGSSGFVMSPKNASAYWLDSNAYDNPGNAAAFAPIGGVGENEHAYDFAFGPYPKLQIVKQVLGGSSTNPFTVTVTGPNAYSVITTVTTSASRAFTVPAVGTYTVTESSLPAAPAGLQWIGTIYAPNSNGTIALADAQTGTVTVTNMLGALATSSAILTVTKQVSGNAPAGQTYNVTVNGPNGVVSQTTIAANQTITFAVTPNVYTVTEASPGAGWLVTFTASSSGDPVSVTNTTQAVVTLTNAITAAAVAPGQITGQAFRDFNSDGQITANGVVTDTGVQSVTVTIYDRNGAVVGGPLQTDANGLYTVTPSADGPWRVEFTNLPASYEPSRSDLGNGTSVQFVNSAPATGVNFGVIDPCDYCQANPLIVGSRNIFSDTAAYPSAVSILSNPYTTTQADGTKRPAEFSSVTYGQVGNTWGRTWKRDTKDLFSAAVSARGLALGSGGPGAIYKVTGMTTGGAQTASTFATIPNVGTVASNAARNLQNMPKVLDAQMYTDTGRVGLGGMTISADYTTLYVMNLNDRSIYPVDASSGVVRSPIAIADPGCGANPYRPWAVKQYRGDLYVGVVCENASNAYVVKLTGPTFASQTVVNTTALNYARERASEAGTCSVAGRSTWKAWTDSSPVPAICNPGDNVIVYPTPLLASLEFADNGDLLMGFADRTAMQLGSFMPSPFLSVNAAALYPNSAGDILRASTSGANSWSGGNPALYETADNMYRSTTIVVHGETALGGLAVWPGRNEFQMTIFDPIDDAAPENYDVYRTGGVKSVGQATGNVHRRYFQYGSHSEAIVNTTGEFPYVFGAKGNGLGDIELLCDAAPIEIGNRAWDDLNANGVQDPGEPGLNGYTVTAVGSDGSSRTTTTSVDGNYYFSATARTLYTLSLSAPSGYTLTVPNAQAISGATNSNHAISDTRDSDAYLAGGTPTIFYQAGTAGQNNHGLDFGFFRSPTGTVVITNTPPGALSLGNYVWLDTNNDGLVNSGETGVGSVAVELYQDTNGDGVFSAGDALVASTNTNSTGYYSFTNLAATTNANSNYLVVITNTNFVGIGPLVGYRSSEGNGVSAPDPDNDQDSDDNGDPVGAYGAAGFVVASKPITLTSFNEPLNESSNGGWNVPTSDANSNATVDFGFYRQQVGNTIWLDANDNGLLDNGELPYTAGPITVALVDNATGAVVSTTTTNNGIYTFTGVPSGTFVVSITVPAGFRSSTPTNNNVGVDSNDNGSASGTFIVSAPFTATPGANAGSIASSNATGTTVNPSIDFGLYAPVVNLGNRVWLDTNNNGLLEGLEVGVNGVRVELYGDTDGNGVYTPGVDTFVRFSDTVNGGYYTFTALPEVNYVVVITSTNFVAGGALFGYSNSTATESNINSNQDETVGGDNGSTTGVLGSGGYVASAAISLTVGSEPSTSVASGDSNWTVDFGFYKLEVGNQVWYDTNNNGLLDGSEVGVVGVPVALLDGSGNVVSTTSTNGSGFYTFTNLASGSYRVVITAPVSYRSSDTNSTSTLNADNDDDGVSQQPIANGTVITSALFTLSAGSSGTSVATDSDGTTRNLAADFGIYKLEVGNQVWFDDNNNGLRDSGETFAPNIAVAILNSAGQVVSTTTTDAGGNYTFTGLISGTYVISITPPVGGLSSDGQVITDGLNLNDHGAPSGAFIVSAPFDLTPGGGGNTNETATNATATTVNYNLDFGLWRPVSVGNYVWFDTNNDGQVGGSEVGVGSVAVELYYDTNNDGAYSPGDVLVSNTQTSNTGYYSFTNLRPTNGIGSAYLVVISSTNFVGSGPLANYRNSSGNNVNGSAPDPDNAVGTDVDSDDNGDEIGSYGAGFLVSSKAITLTPNTEPTSEVGGNGASDPTADSNSNLTVDFGFYKLEVGNQVWIDSNDDGLLNNGEVLTSGIAVALVNPATGAVLSTTTTNAQGFYTFTALVSGTYVISVTPPAGYRSSFGQVATDALDQNDHGGPSGAFITSQQFDLTPGGGTGTNEVANNATGTTQNPNLDFGLYLPRVSLGNYVWFDTDDDGQLGGLEVGVGSVAVELYQDTNNDGVFNAGDVRISTTTTSGTGYYSFTNLVPTMGAGTAYLVVITNTNFVGNGLLAGYRSSDGNGVSSPDPDNDVDSDDNGDESGLYGAGNFVVASKAISVTDRGEPTGELGGNGANDPTRDMDSNLTVDFGFYRLQLGNLVWEDLNNDGQQGIGELGLVNVPVTLYAADGSTVVSTTVTNASGTYTFTGLLSGTYIVAITPPAGYKSSTGASNAYEPGATTFTGATDNTDHGSNAGAEIRSSAIVLRPGDAATNGSGNAITQNSGNTANPTVDFGIWRPASLGDYVWVDTDRDGVQDSSEIGVDGVTVTLLSSTGTVVSVTRTAPNGATNGYYTFTNLISGTYVVSFTLPDGYAWTQTNVGADAADSDAVPQVNPNSLFAVTGPYVLNAGESNPTVDAGVILPTVYLGNRVWFDTNNDGLDNDGTGAASGSSTGTDGVTLELYRDTNGDGIYTPGVDAFVSNTVSAGGGFYNFTNLLQGAYVVVITVTNFVGGPLNGYQSSTDIGSTANPDGNVDRDDNGVTNGALGANGAYVSSRAITLTYAGEPNGQNEAYDTNGNGSLDFGFYKLSMGDTVFEDYNNNGVQDAGEPGIPNVPVALYDSTGNTVLQNTTTDANGVYTFTGLTDDLGYVVGITMTAAYSSSTDIATSATPGNNVNRDDNGTNVNGLVVKSNVITPNAGAAGATNANTVTNATGSTNDPTVDFGIWRPASLGNYVWEDIDNDGQQDETPDLGVNGVQVTLFVFSPTLNAYAVAGTTTTANDPTGNPGYYTFTNLISATYVVAFTAPSGYTFTKQDTGGEPGDSDANPISGQTAPVVLNAGDVNPTVDAGLFRPLSLGNRVFLDTDNNGLDDGAGGGANGSSTGFDGVTVNLYRDVNGNGVLDGGDTAVSNTTTANGGYYTFTNLFSGTYLVQIPPSNFASGGPLFNRANSTGNGTATTDGNTNFDDDGREQGSADNIVSGPITLTAGLEPLNDGAAANDPIADSNSNYSVDFGFFPLASIGDRVWHDYNANGIQDTDEITGVSGVEVVLYDAITGSPVTTTTTGTTGDYTFTKLPPGQYFVQFNLPPVGWATSPADQAGVANDAGDAPNDSDGTPVPGSPNVLRTTTVTLNAGENDPRWDQGIYFTASLGDRMWEDLDRNGVQDAGEPGVVGVTVTLYANGAPISTTQTITNGFYEFSSLTPGVVYSVGFSLPSGYNFTLPNVNTNLSDTVDSDADGVTGGTQTVTLVSGQRYPDLDAGIWRPAGIGDRVWLDNDRDGLQTTSDVGVPNVLVNLYQNGAVLSTTQTDSSGYYSFTGLIPGAYSLTFGLPAGYARTQQDALGNTQDITDSDALTTTGATTTTLLTSGEYDPTWDQGLYQLASLGDYVWEDINHDGVQNENTPIQGVTVVLYDANDVPMLTTTTSITGFYQFMNLEPGNYSVGFTAPAGYTFTKQNNNNPDTSNLDSDVPLSGRTIQVNLVPGENDPNLDAGLWRPAKLGDYVWEDLDADGQQDANEPGMNGVAVALIDSVTGDVVSTTTTYNFLGVDGYYTFTDLISGTYVVSFTAPAGYYFTGPNVLTDTTDSDAVPQTNPLIGATGSYPIFPGDNNPTVDAGIVRPASLGDRVWLDLDRDGRQTGTDMGVPTVTVQLLNAAGSVISTTTTDANGYYTFSNLSPGVYGVQFTIPSGYTYTKQDSGLGDADDSDANPITGKTISTTLISGENDPTWDAGIFPLAGIGDRVWYDVNANGIQDASEIAGVPGITVTLYDVSGTLVATMQTDANGLYSFTNLLPGDYAVGFELPAGWGRSPQDREQNGDDVDSDANIITGRTTTTTLNPGEYDPTWDSGIFELASLGDYVWEDLNHNGRQDFNEPPIQGVTVTLYAADGTTALLTTTTSITGFYQFAGLTPTTFIVGFTTPSGYSPTIPTAAGSTNDSNPNPADGKTAPVALAPGENNPTIDAGYWRPASLGDYVWEDYDNDGQQELGESGINGVLVTLLDNNGNVISTTTTANYLGTDGYYTFTHLISGTYVVSFTNPAGYRVTKDNTGGEPTDSDGVNNGVASVTGSYVLNAGESIPTVDQGYWRPASVGNYVWYDDNVNGINDEPSSKGVNGVTVRLYGSDGTTLISTMVTANDPNGNPGYYTFTDLISGSYQVAFDLTTLPAGYQVTQEGPTTGKDFIDSDPISTTGRTQTITLVAGEADPTWDMGIWKPSGLGDYVWEDYDHDGVQDANEPGVNGVTVNLLDDVGNVISTTITGPNGYYSFTQLKPGTYAVAFVKPSTGGYEFTLPTQGITTTDSNADTTTGQTAPVTLGPGEFNPTIDAGLWRPASLGDYVWEDINHDGLQGSTEPGVNGVLVTLLDDEGNVISTTTTFTGGPNNTAGYYTFTNLISDTYVVSFSLPVGYQWTTPNAFGNGNDTSDSDGVTTGSNPNWAVTGPYVLNAGESIPTVDQGVWRPASVGNYVWMDDDRDGVNDEPSDRGVNGVTVRLLDNEGFPISTTVTANDPNGNPGYYTFTNLAPDRYTVAFDLTTLPKGYTVTVPGASGSKDATDSDADPVTGRTEEITLVTGEADPTWDMGIWTPASLGDYVWEDYDHDGIQDLNEPPVQGVQVVLYDAANTPILTTTTSITGFYRFDGLTPSVPYYVGFTAPAGYEFTKQGTNPISALDSNADPVTGKTAPIILISGEYNPTLDAGLFRPASLGDYVWVDTNANGLQDESATGVNGVTVELLDAAGNVLSTTTTFTGGPNNAAGYYTFTNLISSTYQVRFTAPAGYSVTKPNSGNDTTDSDGVVSGSSPFIATTGLYVLNAGESNPTVDLGLFKPASLGDRVWYDYDADGIQDSNEVTGVVGVQVVLYDAITNKPVATTTTGADGLYAFTNLVPGSYFVEFTLPTGYGRSPGDVSGTGKDATDSDANQTTGRTVPVTLVSGENDPTWDAGIYQLSSLGDRVWEDKNLNGTQDGGEPGVAGVVVTLYLNGVPISTTTTDASGFYGFYNLTPTVPYTLAFALPPGYTGFTKVDVGSDATDSDANPVTGATGPITLLPGENNPNVDAGVVKPAGLGDFVWVDVNRDGQQQPGEPGVPGVVVTLYQNGVPVGTTTTNASGYYSFTNLTPGVPYSVSFGLPGGFAWTLPTVGITTTDSNADSNGGTPPVTLVSGEYNPTIDAGVISTLKLDKVGVGSGMNGAIGKDKLITYTIVVSNSGAGAISNVTVDDPLMATQSYAGRSTPPPISTNPLKWNLGTLNAGETKTIVFVVNAIVNTGTLTNVAYVNGPLGDKLILMAQDDANILFAPDAVALMRFEAKRDKGSVKIIWQTSQEVNTFGFALYRSESFDYAQDAKRSDAVLATAELIPAQGRTGGSYAFLDVNAKANKRYTYWLIEAETTGAMNEYGPTVVNAETAEVALLPVAVAEAGGVPVASLPVAVAEPVKALGQRVLVETQPQAVNAVVAQQVMAQQTAGATDSSTSMSTSSSSSTNAPAQVALVSRAAVMEAIANPPKPQPQVVAPEPASVAVQPAAVALAENVAPSVQTAPAQAVAAQAEPVKAQPAAGPKAQGSTIGLLIALLVAGLMLVAAAGAGVVFMRKRGRRE